MELLIYRAFDFLDNLDAAYAFAVEFRCLAIARHHKKERKGRSP